MTIVHTLPVCWRNAASPKASVVQLETMQIGALRRAMQIGATMQIGAQRVAT